MKKSDRNRDKASFEKDTPTEGTEAIDPVVAAIEVKSTGVQADPTDAAETGVAADASESSLAATSAADVAATPDTTVGKPVRIAVAAVTFVVLGVSAGLGIVLLSDGGSSAPASPVVTDVPAPVVEGGEGPQRAKFDDALREWNMQASAYISPLISQLARAPRTTLGGQIALCKEQRSILQPVLELDAPPNNAVSPTFERWRSALRQALDACIERRPSGDDAEDIKRITREISDTEALFATFLRTQLPFVDVEFQANPESFERR